MIYEFENTIGNKEKWKPRKHHKKRCAEGGKRGVFLGVLREKERRTHSECVYEEVIADFSLLN
jgi:hypothetical protein